MINVILNSDAKTLHVVASSVIEITDIYIDTQKTFNCENEPSINASHLNVESTLEEDDLYHIDIDIDLTSLSLGSTILTANINTDLFFVFVQSGVSYMLDIAYDNNYLMDYVFHTLSNSLIINNCCENINNVPIDILLLYYAFIHAKNYRDKIFFWNKIYLNNINKINKCRCDGR